MDKATANEETDYVSGPSGALARITNGAVTYLHSDHLGSASSGTNASGTKLWTERYTPYGEALLTPAANDSLAGYTGHIRDKATGLTYMQARYQDPVMGRFLSVDPVTFMDSGAPGMFNRYAYTLNDPVNMIDPDGEWAWLVTGAVIGGGAAGYAQSKNLPANNDYIGGRIENTISVAKATAKGAALGALGGGVATLTTKAVVATGSTTGALGIGNNIAANGLGGGTGALAAYSADVATDDEKNFDLGDAVDTVATGIAVGTLASGTGHAAQGATGALTKEGSKLPSVVGAAASQVTEAAASQTELQVAPCKSDESC